MRPHPSNTAKVDQDSTEGPFPRVDYLKSSIFAFVFARFLTLPVTDSLITVDGMIANPGTPLRVLNNVNIFCPLS